MPPSDQGVTAPAAVEGVTVPVTYKLLKQTHPDYDAEYWRRLCAFYEGGRALLGNADLMAEVFPRHRDEVGQVYAERLKRAHYLPYPAEILDFITSSLFTQPLRVTLGNPTGDEEKAEELPDFYRAWLDDVSPPKGEKVAMGTLARRQVLAALKMQTAWTLVEMEASRPGVYASLGEQEKAGDLRPWALAIDPCCVIDWEEDEAGDLQWAIVHQVTAKRASLTGDRKRVTQRWTFYTPLTWHRYEVEHPQENPPKETDIIPLVGEGDHGFGSVPLIRMALPDGLWAMNKIESAARELFNKDNILAWAEFQAGAPELYEFLGPEMPSAGAMIGSAQEDPARAKRQARGQGYVQERGKDDRAEFVGPDTSAFSHLLASRNSLRDEIHRVTHQMALTIDNSASALKRSAESKNSDKVATASVLLELGRYVRDHVERILNLVSTARVDKETEGKWHVQGMDDFEAVDTTGLVDLRTALNVAGKIASPTFNRKLDFMVCKSVLADEATDDVLDIIEDELESNITPEEFDPAAIADADAAAAALAAGGQQGGGKPPVPGAKKPPPKKPPAGGGGGRMFDSRGGK